jgi:hypothetical protein
MCGEVKPKDESLEVLAKLRCKLVHCIFINRKRDEKERRDLLALQQKS